MSNDDWHPCHFCGTNVKEGFENNGERHWLSDCRPDLVEHEIGETCTWGYQDKHKNSQNCWAYHNLFTLKWTDKHVHFYREGPM